MDNNSKWFYLGGAMALIIVWVISFFAGLILKPIEKEMLILNIASLIVFIFLMLSIAVIQHFKENKNKKPPI